MASSKQPSSKSPLTLALLTFLIAAPLGRLVAESTPSSNQNHSPRYEVAFTENKGQVSDQFYQARPDVLFYGSTNGMNYHLRKDGISYQIAQPNESSTEWTKEDDREAIQSVNVYRTDIHWLGANADVRVKKGAALPGFENFYTASVPNGATHVMTFESVTYQELYDGIDLKWYKNNGELEYDFVIEPGADYHQIQWQISGSEKVFVNESGQLVIQTPLGEIIENTPIAFQDTQEIDAKWSLHGSIVSFEVGEYDTSSTLIIDPIVRQWGTYYGGTSPEYAEDCVVDKHSNIFITGWTQSNSAIATSGSHQSTIGGGQDAYAAKFDHSGVRIWATYYGGTSGDLSNSCSIDANSNMYFTGRTYSTNGIATTGTHQTSLAGDGDAFLVKLDSSGTRIWGTYFGGVYGEQAFGCAVDTTLDFIYIVGQTVSPSGISTTGSHQFYYAHSCCTTDAFIAQFDTTGTRTWSTYYGGNHQDRLRTCIVDSASNLYVGGWTRSSNGIATSGAFKDYYTFNGDGVFAKFTSAGVRQWGTYYGEQGGDEFHDIIIDASFNLYLAGQTSASLGIATPGAHQDTISGNGSLSNDGMLVKFDSSGARLWGTYYGGTGSDYAYTCALDKFANVYLGGRTNSTGSNDLIASSNGYQTSLAGSYDAFLAKFDSSGVRDWGTYYGGSSWDDALGSAVFSDTSSTPAIFIVGSTVSSSAISTSGSHQSSLGGSIDGFMAKFSECTSGTTGSDTVMTCDSYESPSGNYTWTSSGTYLDTIANAIGCDSIITIELTILTTTDTMLYVEACSSYTAPSGGSTWTSDGIYTDTLTNASGCDSILTINLTINQTQSQINATACDSYTSPSGNYTWTSSGTYLDTIPNSVGCDSSILINLTILSSTSNTETVNACDSYFWEADSTTYLASGTYSTTLTNSVGCDSFATLQLTVNTVDTTVIQTGPTLTALATGATFQWLDCANSFAPISGETSNSFTPDTSGNYAVAINVNECLDTSACFEVILTGIQGVMSATGVTLFPNPTKGLVQVNLGKTQQEVTVTVRNSVGQLVYHSTFLDQRQFEFKVDGAAGLYLVTISNSNGESSTLRLLKY